MRETQPESVPGALPPAFDARGADRTPATGTAALGVVLRRAVPADEPLLARWDEEPHVIESDPNDDWSWAASLLEDPPWRAQLMAEVAGRPVGFVQIIDAAEEESHYWGEVAAGLYAIDIWIGDAADLGQGYGSVMMALALARCFAVPSVTGVLIDPLASNVDAHRFYERLGFRWVERRTFGEDDCFVYRLDRAEWAARAAGPQGLGAAAEAGGT